jgi:hypothetical protein
LRLVSGKVPKKISIESQRFFYFHAKKKFLKLDPGLDGKFLAKNATFLLD